MLKITNRLIKEAAEQQGWTVEVLNADAGLLRLRLGERQVIINSVLSPFTPVTAMKIADDKLTSFLLAREAEIPVAGTHAVDTLDEALELLQTYRTIVIKPAGEAHGNGVTTHIRTTEDARQAFAVAAAYKSGVLVQPHLSGDDVRLLYIGGELAAAAKRYPAAVTGDGQHTVRELIDSENQSGRRAADYQLPMNFIDVAAAERYLGDRMDTIVEAGHRYQVVGTANIGTGGTAEDITESVSDDLIAAGRKLLGLIGLETGAADFIVEESGYVLLEVNANPSFGLHTFPAKGQSRPVAGRYVDWLQDKLSAGL